MSFKLWAAMQAWRLGERLVRNARPTDRERAVEELQKATERLRRK